MRPSYRNQLLRFSAAALAVAALAEPCLAYGGWNYADPQGATAAVVELVTRGLILWGVAPYLLFATLAWRVRRLPRYALATAALLYLLWTLFFIIPQLAVMGELGPAHLALDIVGSATGAFFLIFYVRICLTWWAGSTPPPRTWIVRLAMSVLIAAEVAILVAAVTAPIVLTPARFARDAGFKLQTRKRFVAEMIEDYRKANGSLPESITEIPEYTEGSDIFLCPLTGQRLTYQVDQKAGTFTLTCPSQDHAPAK